MQNVSYISLNAANKSVRGFIAFFAVLVCWNASSSFAGLRAPAQESATNGMASPPDASTPTPGHTPDLTQIPMMPVAEAQKNSNKTYQIGDRITLLVELKGNLAENGEHLELKVPEGSSKLEDQGWYVDPSTQLLSGVYRFIASPIQTGSLTLPTLLIMKDDQTVVGRTAPFSIQVTGPEKKENSELVEITPSALAAKYWVMFSILALLIMGLVSYLVFRFYKNRKKKPKILPEAPIELDHVRALKKLESIYQAHPYRMENLKPVTFGISETLKEFFSTRFKIDASEATTDEMIELLRKEAIAGENLKEIQNLFADLDLVKFTRSENYSHFDESKYQDLKVKAQWLIQKWKLTSTPRRPNP